MRVTFHGKFADIFGRRINLELPQACSIAELFEKLAALRPEFGTALTSPRVRACVDNRIVADSFVLHPGQAVEVLAPLSGG